MGREVDENNRDRCSGVQEERNTEEGHKGMGGGGEKKGGRQGRTQEPCASKTNQKQTDRYEIDS